MNEVDITLLAGGIAGLAFCLALVWQQRDHRDRISFVAPPPAEESPFAEWDAQYQAHVKRALAYERRPVRVEGRDPMRVPDGAHPIAGTDMREFEESGLVRPYRRRPGAGRRGWDT